MKTITIYLLLSMSSLSARESGATPDVQIFQQLQLHIDLDFTGLSKRLPKTFEEINSLREFLKENPRAIGNLNKFVVIPEAPIIKPTQGLTQEFSGHRLFVISRFSDIQSSKVGRLALFATIDSSSCYPCWIPEPQFEIILKQLKGFDPEKQPLAFQDLTQDYRKSLVNQEGAARREVSTNNGPRPTSPTTSNLQSPSERPTDYVPFWIGGGILFVSLVTWNALRLRKHDLDKKRTESTRSRNK